MPLKQLEKRDCKGQPPFAGAPRAPAGTLRSLHPRFCELLFQKFGVTHETRKRYEAGMPPFEAAKSITMDRYAFWTDRERVAVTVGTIYRKLNNDPSHADRIQAFREMAQLAPGA